MNIRQFMDPFLYPDKKWNPWKEVPENVAPMRKLINKSNNNTFVEK